MLLASAKSCKEKKKKKVTVSIPQGTYLRPKSVILTNTTGSRLQSHQIKKKFLASLIEVLNMTLRFKLC